MSETRPAVVTGHEFVPDPNGKDECLFSPDGSWGTTCWWSRVDHAPTDPKEE